MLELVIPTVGSTGYFELRSPYNTKVIVNERQTCQAIRRISDYIANNEDVKQLVYIDNGLTQADYDLATSTNMYIASLQSDRGHWVYVPVDYIVKFPITNGIPYRNITIGVALPPIPATRDISNLETDITNLIIDSLGVSPVIKQVQTSRVILVSKDKHDIQQASRDATASGRVTDRSRYMSLVQDHQLALNKITELETYIQNNIPAPI
jgi:hypothetical protein